MINEKQEEQQNFDIPEGKILDHIELHCEKHDDITKGSMFLSYTTKQADGKVIQHQNFFCVQCITELLSEFASQGKIGKLNMVRVFRDRTEDDDKAEQNKNNTQSQTDAPEPQESAVVEQ